jgi:hypothetical protein
MTNDFQALLNAAQERAADFDAQRIPTRAEVEAANERRAAAERRANRKLAALLRGLAVQEAAGLFALDASNPINRVKTSEQALQEAEDATHPDLADFWLNRAAELEAIGR